VKTRAGVVPHIRLHFSLSTTTTNSVFSLAIRYNLSKLHVHIPCSYVTSVCWITSGFALPTWGRPPRYTVNKHAILGMDIHTQLGRATEWRTWEILLHCLDISWPALTWILDEATSKTEIEVVRDATSAPTVRKAGLLAKPLACLPKWHLHVRSKFHDRCSVCDLSSFKLFQLHILTSLPRETAW